ncbi:MAG TPA: hypothetical protein VGG08_05030 [Solirubrobacteraceae bacterium]|jgi:hypothetical protein
MTTARVLGGLLAIAALTLPAAGAASAAPELNVTGTWNAVYHCEVGSCAGKSLMATLALTQAAGSNAVAGKLTGTAPNGEALEGTITGSLAGHALTLEGVGTKGYTAKGVETISEDGLDWTGSYEDSSSTRGLFTAVREAPPVTAVGTRPSAIQVLCNLVVASGDFTCTAQVGDASEAKPSIVPTGTVKFLAIGERGVFTPTESCALVATPNSPNVASCSVTYVPPTGGIPAGTPVPVSGTYEGDGTFATSTVQAGEGANVSPTASAASAVSEGASTTVTCPNGVVSCPVTVKLSVVEEGKAVSAKVKRRTVTIGSKAATIAGGTKKKITVSLNKAGKRLLARHHHLSARLEVISFGKVVKKQTVQIKPRHKG